MPPPDLGHGQPRLRPSEAAEADAAEAQQLLARRRRAGPGQPQRHEAAEAGVAALAEERGLPCRECSQPERRCHG